MTQPPTLDTDASVRKALDRFTSEALDRFTEIILEGKLSGRQALTLLACTVQVAPSGSRIIPADLTRAVTLYTEVTRNGGASC